MPDSTLSFHTPLPRLDRTRLEPRFRAFGARARMRGVSPPLVEDADRDAHVETRAHPPAADPRLDEQVNDYETTKKVARLR